MAFFPLANLIDLYDGYRQSTRIRGVPLLLLQDEGVLYLMENRCPHMDAKLDTGTVSDGAITCRAHGIAFQLKSGRALGPLAGTLECLRFYDLVYDGNKVGVDL